jgi:hypothetical protein
MASRTRHNKRKTRKTVKQRGGVWPFTPKAPILTPEEQLKKDALENLTSNGKTIQTITDNEILGKYTYGVDKTMRGTVPEYKIYVKLPIGIVADH